MEDPRFRLSSLRVAEVVHGFPVVDWSYHGLNIRFFKCHGDIRINLAFEVGFKLLIRDFLIDYGTRLCSDTEETSVTSYVDSIIHVCFV